VMYKQRTFTELRIDPEGGFNMATRTKKQFKTSFESLEGRELFSADIAGAMQIKAPVMEFARTHHPAIATKSVQVFASGLTHGSDLVALSATNIVIHANAFSSHNGISTLADGQLRSDNTLTVSVAGTNNSNFTYGSHEAEVQLLGRDGRPLHTGYYSVWVGTSGRFVPGHGAASNSHTWNIASIGLNWRQVYTMRVTALS
jgi:hypothetical protein